MKVISFHAYKGGRGRTTAIASIANLYARAGKHVAVLDADVTAPWLHTRYGVSPQTLASRGWLRGLLKKISTAPASVVPAVDLNEESVWIDLERGGSVRLLAPGNPETADYWTWMAEEFPRFFGVHAEPHITDSWRVLRAMIAGAEPRPDVLLVDAPAGYHQASAYIALAIADTAVLFAQEDHADAAWTTQMAQMMREARPEETAARIGELDLIGVRARYPGYIHPDIGAERRFAEFQAPYAQAEFDRWISLESDPRIELLHEEIPIALHGKIHRTRLVDGYAELLAASLGKSGDGSAFFEELPEGEVVAGERPQFFLLGDFGFLLNPADETRNVSFRVETFCALLDDLHRELAESPVPPDAEEATAPPALEVAGREPGRKFGESLADQLTDLDPPPDDVGRIRRWCEFDSRVGFGGLSLTEYDESPEGHVTAGMIEVEGNFLATGRSTEDFDLCPLLNGYIEGVLSKLLRSGPSTIEVEHSDDRCMRVTKGRSSCEFDFRVVGRPAGGAG